MKRNRTLEFDKIIAIGKEIEDSYNFIKEGIRYLKNQKLTIDLLFIYLLSITYKSTTYKRNECNYASISIT